MVTNTESVTTSPTIVGSADRRKWRSIAETEIIAENDYSLWK